MAQTDLSLAQLQEFQPEVAQPADFREFWDETLTASRAAAAVDRIRGGGPDGFYSCEKVATRFPTCDFYDVTFPGFNGEAIAGWLIGPAGFMDETNLPVVVEYRGYGGGRGVPGQELTFAPAGFVHLLMDSRAQGGDWTRAVTLDPHPSTPQASGFMCNGIEDRDTYYYRRLITDAVRAVDAVHSLNCINRDRIFVTGESQGGGLTLAVCALNPRVRGGAPGVAFLCNFPRAAAITDTNPYRQIARYLWVYPERTEQVWNTLAYFDGVNFARIATTPTLWEVGLADDICPPSTTFSAYNVYAGPKRMEVYPYAGHEGGTIHHLLKRIDWFNELD